MITGIVLAGGRASRLGGSKLDLRIGPSSILELAIQAIGRVADEVVIAGPPVPRLVRDVAGTPPPIRFVEDREAFPGPLAALRGALDVAGGDRAIVVAGDMPFLVPAVLRMLVERLAVADEPATDAVLLEAPGAAKRQVLPLAVRVTAVAGAARSAVDDGDRSLVRLLDRIGGVEIPASEWQALDPRGRTLVDIDEPADLERWITG